MIFVASQQLRLETKLVILQNGSVVDCWCQRMRDLASNLLFTAANGPLRLKDVGP